MPEKLTVWCPWPEKKKLPSRIGRILEAVLDGTEHLLATDPSRMPENTGRILFCIVLDRTGMNPEYYRMLRLIRSDPVLLEGCLAGIIVDGKGELYTKAVARELVFSANMSGCAFVGRPLVEATGNLNNFTNLARSLSCSLEEAYRTAAEELISRLTAPAETKPVKEPEILALHASNRSTSNTLALWQKVREGLTGCRITEIGLRNGAVEDCAGCHFRTCLHYGEQGSCFYGGVIAEDVYPAIGRADALMLICPNYNDAVSANITAFINRMSAMYRKRYFYDKALFAIIVSGYSGSDLVAGQLIAAMAMNKSFYLPPRFCLMASANDAGTVLTLPGIRKRIQGFREQMQEYLKTYRSGV